MSDFTTTDFMLKIVLVVSLALQIGGIWICHVAKHKDEHWTADG